MLLVRDGQFLFGERTICGYVWMAKGKFVLLARWTSIECVVVESVVGLGRTWNQALASTLFYLKLWYLAVTGYVCSLRSVVIMKKVWQ